METFHTGLDFDPCGSYLGDDESLPINFLSSNIFELWLHAPLVMFNGRRPIDLIKNGEAERIIQLLVRLEEGIHF